MPLRSPELHIFFNYASGGEAVSETENIVREKGAEVTAVKVDVAFAEAVDAFF